MIWIILLVVIVILVVWIAGTYNNLVGAKNKVTDQWSQIDVVLKRRFDLIPNLVETVKGYMAHEEGVLEKVTELRTSWANAKTVEDKANIDSELSGALKTIMAVSENYPDLKANQNFVDLQNSLKETENKIAYSRQFYNDTVTIYNTKLEVFPNNIVGSMFNFKPESLFEVESGEARKNVKVDFNK